MKKQYCRLALLALSVGFGLVACDDSVVAEPGVDLGQGRLRDAYMAPTGGSNGDPVIPVLDGTVPNPPRGGQSGAGGQPAGGERGDPGGQPSPGGAAGADCPEGEIWISNRCELMCFDDLNCPAGTHCNAQEVCLEPPDCQPGEDCTMVCVGWCVQGAAPDPDPDPDPCVPACEPGEARCFGALIRRCEPDATGCPRWSGSMPCPDGRVCQNDRCDGDPACQDECFPNQSQCAGDALQRCVEVEPGCLQWGPPEPCPGELICEFNACRCDSECLAPRRECVEGGYRTCLNMGGCGGWSPPEACPGGTECQNGLCRARPCEHGCDFLGVRECVGDLVRTCEQDENRCRYWAEPIACEGGRLCRAQGCVFVCEEECPFVGAQSCDGEREILLCDRDPVTRCRVWRPFTQCNEGQRCEEGRCFNN